MIHKEFRAGEFLFSEGEPSDHAYRILTGEVDIVKENQDEAFVLGTAKVGDFVGEMGVIRNSPRIAAARAVTALNVEVFGKDEFLQRITVDNEMAVRLLSRLSGRFKVVSEAFVEAISVGAPRAEACAGEAAAAPSSLRMFAASNRLVRLLPLEGVLVNLFPFVVGRLPRENELQPSLPVDLALPDAPPYRLSRIHFSIDRDNGGYMVRDMHSNRGTEVNGQAVGDRFASDRAPLREGENVVVAGGPGSTYKFRLLLERHANGGY